jgi:hypothetical protein
LILLRIIKKGVEMKRPNNFLLSPDWLTQGYADTELKQYLMLAFEQKAKQSFDSNYLYPVYWESKYHLKELKILMDLFQAKSKSFPQQIKGMGPDDQSWNFENTIPLDSSTAWLFEIIDFALPILSQLEKEGSKLEQKIQQDVSIQPAGIIPVYRNEGYMFIHRREESFWWIYGYRTFIWSGDIETKSPEICFTYVDQVKLNPNSSITDIKLKLIHDNPFLPVPAVYQVESGDTWPLEESILPIISKKLTPILEE